MLPPTLLLPPSLHPSLPPSSLSPSSLSPSLTPFLRVGAGSDLWGHQMQEEGAESVWELLNVVVLPEGTQAGGGPVEGLAQKWDPLYKLIS